MILRTSRTQARLKAKLDQALLKVVSDDFWCDSLDGSSGRTEPPSRMDHGKHPTLKTGLKTLMPRQRLETEPSIYSH